MNIQYCKLNQHAIQPSSGSSEAAGLDLYSSSEQYLIIRPHETLKIGTGIAISIPSGYFGAIFARSGIATKRGLRPANCVGVIDSDYRGEVIVAIHNDSDEEQTVAPFERIAQLVIMPYLSAELTEVETLDSTNRGSNGFGSTGTN